MTDKSSCGYSRYEESGLVLHSLSVTYCTAASKQWLSQQSHSQLSWLMLPSGSSGRKDHHTNHSSGSFERKLCAFSFSFNCRTSKMTVVLSVKQEARPAELRGSGGPTLISIINCQPAVTSVKRLVSQNWWIVEGRGLSPFVISHPLQPCHQTTTGQPKFPKCTRDAYRMQSRQPLPIHSNLDIF